MGRVIAVAGDTVDITDDGKLIVNGNTINEPKIFYKTPRYEGYEEFPLTVPQGEYFILVDRREGGEDSRYYGTVTAKEIKGSVVTLIRRNNM
jgi:signal peptidase I